MPIWLIAIIALISALLGAVGVAAYLIWIFNKEWTK